MGYLYYDLGVSGGAIIEYQDFTTPQSPGIEQQLPEGISPDFNLDELVQEPPADPATTVEDPDTPVSNETETNQ